LYNGGRAPYSTVLQAEEQLFPAELNLVTVRADLLVSLVNIYKAMGGGWVEHADNMVGDTQKPEQPAAAEPSAP
jgi:multidrug efflux system outer membrane protein